MSLLKKPILWFLLSAVGIVTFRIPLILAPVFDNDEGIYASIGHYLTQGEVLYRDVWDNKLPAIYFLFGWILQLTHNPSYIRVLGTLCLLISSGLSFYLAIKLLPKLGAYLSLLIFSLLLIIPIFETFTSNAEVFFLPLSTAAIVVTALIEWFGWNKRWYMVVGFALALGVLLKVVVVFDAMAILSLLLLRHTYRIRRELLFLIIGGALGLALPSYYILHHGILLDTYKAAFLGNIGYVGYGNVVDLGPIHLKSSAAMLVGKLMLVVLALGYIWWSFRRITSAMQLVYIWLVWDLFSVFFSGHPYPHYLIQIIPALSITLSDQLAMSLTSLKELPTKFISLGARVVVGGLIVIALFANFGNIFKPFLDSSEINRIILGYAGNGYQYLSGQITKDQFYSFYGESAVRNYTLSERISSLTLPEDKIFIWGNTPWIYYFSSRGHVSRFLVSYHVDLTPGARSEALGQLQSQKPKLILWVKDPGNSSQNPPARVGEMEQFINSNYQFVETVNHIDLLLRTNP